MAKTVQLIPVDESGQEINLQSIDDTMNGTFTEDQVPKWAQQHPTAYASLMTMFDLAPQVANLAKSSVVGIPLAGALNVGAQAAKRGIHGGSTSLDQAMQDALIGMGGQVLGDVVGKGIIPVAAKGLPESLSKWLYKSALKPGTTIPPDVRTAMVQRGLSEGVTLDGEGADALMERMLADKARVMLPIERGSAARETIPVQSVVNEFNRGGDNSLSYLASLFKGEAPEINNVLQQRINTLRSGGPDMDVKKAQLLKEHYQNQATYPSDVRGMYDEQIDQATARGLRKSLEDKYPEIAPLNAANKERADLWNQLVQKGTLGRIDNRDPTGLGLTMAANMADPSNPMSQLNFVARVVQNFPRHQAKLAIEMYKAKTGKVLPIKKYRQAVRFLANEELQRTLNNPQGGQYMTPTEQSMLTTGE